MLNVTTSRLGATTADTSFRRREIERLRAFSDRITLLARVRKATVRRRVLVASRS